MSSGGPPPCAGSRSARRSSRRWARPSCCSRRQRRQARYAPSRHTPLTPDRPPARLAHIVHDPAGRTMDRQDDAAAVDRNFIATFRALGEGVAGALVRTIGRVPVAATMMPLAFFNAAFVAEPLGDAAHDREAAVTPLRELGVPFTVHLRSDLDPATRTAGDGLGLVWTGTLPGMAMRSRPAPDLPPGLTIRRATTAAVIAAAAPGVEVAILQASAPGLPSTSGWDSGPWS